MLENRDTHERNTGISQLDLSVQTRIRNSLSSHASMRLHHKIAHMQIPLVGCIFYWTHFRLSLWMATHLRMRNVTPSVKGVLNMIE